MAAGSVMPIASFRHFASRALPAQAAWLPPAAAILRGYALEVAPAAIGAYRLPICAMPNRCVCASLDCRARCCDAANGFREEGREWLARLASEPLIFEAMIWRDEAAAIIFGERRKRGGRRYTPSAMAFRRGCSHHASHATRMPASRPPTTPLFVRWAHCCMPPPFSLLGLRQDFATPISRFRLISPATALLALQSPLSSRRAIATMPHLRYLRSYFRHAIHLRLSALEPQSADDLIGYEICSHFYSRLCLHTLITPASADDLRIAEWLDEGSRGDGLSACSR